MRCDGPAEGAEHSMGRLSAWPLPRHALYNASQAQRLETWPRYHFAGKGVRIVGLHGQI